MDANSKAREAELAAAKGLQQAGLNRVAVSAALLSVMLGACSSVPDSVNPVKWYEKTTDFFSGDSQAAGGDQTQQTGENKGLAADPDAPPPAAQPPVDEVANAPRGLAADQASGNYASPPIERQGAPRDVLRPEDAAATQQAAVPGQPPAPMAQPIQSVTSSPQQLDRLQAQPQPMTMADASSMAPADPNVPPSMSPSTPPQPFQRTVNPMDSMSTGAPSAPDFAPSAMDQAPMSPFGDPYGSELFETVVITGDGLDTMAAAPAQMPGFADQSAMAAGGPQFPQPGMTTLGDAGTVNVGGYTRLATIHFANSTSEMDERDRSILAAVVQLQRERGGRVVIVGHASSRTRDMDYVAHQMVNFQVSNERAATVGNALRDMGLAPELLEVQAVSDTQPLYQEIMPSGEAGNRRVEIYLAP